MSVYAPAPTFATPRDPAAPTEGRAIGKLARIMGKPFMPHQQLVSDVGTELRPDGGYKYPIVMVTLPRQSGKTTMLGPVQLHRIITRPNIKTFFTAQTGKDARARFNDLTHAVIDSPLASFVKVRRAAGSEGIFLGNGSSLNVFAPTPSAIHGETPHLVTLDEIWHHDEVRGNELMGAIGPAQITLGHHAQIWMISTQGTALSGFMNAWVEKGRAGMAGMAYFEWSAPAGADGYDPQTWWTFHPALGNTITVADLAAQAKVQTAAEWERAYMNRRTDAADPLIGSDDWATLAGDLEPPARADVAIAYEVAAGNASAAVYAVWRDAAGRPCAHVVHAAPGSTWLAPYVRRLADEWRPAVIAADDGGPTRRITDELTREMPGTAGRIAPVDVYTLGPRDFATACDATLTAARDDKTLRHDGSATLAAAVAHAVTRPMGEGIRFSRSHSTGPIAALIAVAVGLWAYDHQEASLGKPVLTF